MSLIEAKYARFLPKEREREKDVKREKKYTSLQCSVLCVQFKSCHVKREFCRIFFFFLLLFFISLHEVRIFSARFFFSNFILTM